MNYSLKTVADLRSLRNRFLAALASDRLNSTNRVNIERWISEAEAELLNRAGKGVEIAAAPKRPAPATPAAPALYQMRNGTTAPRNVSDQNRLSWSMWS